MRVNLKLLSELVKLSDGWVYFDAMETYTVVFVAKDKKSVYIILDKDGRWDAPVFWKNMMSVSAKNVLKLAKAYGYDSVPLWCILDTEIGENGWRDESEFGDYVFDITKIVEQLFETFKQPTGGSVMGYLPQSRDIKIVELLRDLYGEYNERKVFFRFPNTKDTYKDFTVKAIMDNATIYGAFVGMSRPLIEWY